MTGFPYERPEPRFIAHALPSGAFALDDDAAKAEAKRWCPAAPPAIRSSLDALCARLWARTPAETMAARALVTKSCVGGWCDRENASKPQPANAAEDCERRRKWFEKTPPLTLP